MSHDDIDVDVLVVGAGPTGLAAANALGIRGINTLVIDQDSDVAEQPRAVSIDDEGMRLMQSLGFGARAGEVFVPGTGTKYFGARGQLLVYGRGPERQPHGHPVKNPMDHPSFQRMLRSGLERFSNVRVNYETRLIALEQSDQSVTATVEQGNEERKISCRYVIGADGGRSVTRTLIGQEPMEGAAFEQRWLVVDTINDHHDERYAMHYGDPKRPRVVVVGRDGRCRYEFLLHANEHPTGDALLDLAIDLVKPDRQLEVGDIVRCTVYKFYGLVAGEFQLGRVFIAGDAAHLMPPFAGQGLNSGLRDASNLCWKLAAVIDGTAAPELLHTYSQERRPHVEAIMRLSVRMGAVMMTESRLRAALRDLLVAGSQRLPVFNGFFRELKFKPVAHYGQGFVVDPGHSPGPIGSMIVQPRVFDRLGNYRQLDDVMGPGFALLSISEPGEQADQLTAPLWHRLGARHISVAIDDRLPARAGYDDAVADPDGLLAEQLGSLHGHTLLIRPDRFIAGSFKPSDERAFAEDIERRLGSSTHAQTIPTAP